TASTSSAKTVRSSSMCRKSTAKQYRVMTSMICCLSSSSLTASPDICVFLSRARLPRAGLSSVDPPDVAVGPAPRGRDQIENQHGLVDGLAQEADRRQRLHAGLELLFRLLIDLSAGIAEVAEVGRCRPRCDGVDPDAVGPRLHAEHLR